MTRSPDRGPTDTGVLVYPKMEVPNASRESDPRVPRRPAAPTNKRAVLLVAVLVAGGAAGFFVRPMVAPDARIGQLEATVTEAQQAATTQQSRADTLDKSLTTITAAKVVADKKLEEAQKAQAELAGKMADSETKKKDAAAVQAKIKAAVDKSAGAVATEGDEVHIQLADRVLFKTGDDQLTDRGRQVMSRIAAALKDLPDKQVWVQGHTDDQPIFNPPPPPPKKPVKGAPAPPPPSPPRFATNWELSAARALSVVHYMQDTAKLDPTRLAALAFSQYRPASRGNKAANRRIEIVLVPKRPAPSK